MAKPAFVAIKVPAGMRDVFIEHGFLQQLQYVQREPGDTSDHNSDTRNSLGALIHRWNALTL